MKLPILIAMVLYMAMVIWIGVIYSKKTKTSEDYFLGGRGLGPWVTAMSAEASDMSSWLLMGLPGLAYATGFSQAGWTAIGLILGTYLNWKIVAKRLRHYTEVADNAITVPDFFSNRFKDDKKILSSISAVMILIFFTVYTASGFAACGTLFNSVFGLNYQKSMIVCAIVIVLYTSMGGFLAASTTDLIQGLLMSFAIVIVLIVGVVNAGGVANVIAHGQAIEGFFDVCRHRGLTGDQGVIIPRTNVKDLMLREDVLNAVDEGKFHIYAVDNVDDGIEILTGIKAGKPDKHGNYPKGTVNYAVRQGLEYFYKRYVKFAKETHGCLGR